MNVQQDEFILSPLWYNDLIKIGEKVYFLNNGSIRELD